MDEGTVRNEQAPPISAAAGAPARHAIPPPRHEVEPTVPYAMVPGAVRDTLLFYHMEAAGTDTDGLWEYSRFCVSNLYWVTDHFVVTPNPCYLNQTREFEERFAKIERVLLNWYCAKRMVGSLELAPGWPDESDEPA